MKDVYEVTMQSENATNGRTIRRMYSSKVKIVRLVQEFKIRKYGADCKDTWSASQVSILETQNKVRFDTCDSHGNPINVTIEKHPVF